MHYRETSDGLLQVQIGIWVGRRDKTLHSLTWIILLLQYNSNWTCMGGKRVSVRPSQAKHPWWQNSAVTPGEGLLGGFLHDWARGLVVSAILDWSYHLCFALIVSCLIRCLMRKNMSTNSTDMPINLSIMQIQLTNDWAYKTVGLATLHAHPSTRSKTRSTLAVK